MICWNTELLHQRVNAVFIGGPADGHRRVLSVRRPVWKISYSISGRPVRPDSTGFAVRDYKFHSATYKSFDLSAGKEIFTVYAWDQLSDEDVLRMLIDNYVGFEQ